MYFEGKFNNELSAYARNVSELEMLAEEFLIESGLVCKRVYAGNVKKFIYDYLRIDTAIGRHQKTLIGQTDEISVYEIVGIKKTKIFMFDLKEYSFEVYLKVLVSLKSLAKCNVICCFLDEVKQRYALCGRLYSVGNENTNLIISDWLSEYGISTAFGEKINVDFSECSCDEKLFYGDFLYLIARPYIRYPESKMFISMGCNSYWYYLDEDAFCETSWDREEFFEINSRYYRDLYQEDFFDDFSENSIPLEEFEDIEYDEEEDDLEWTLLEIQLKEEYDNEEYFDEDEEEIDDSIDIEFEMPKDLSPLQMLEFIKNSMG